MPDREMIQLKLGSLREVKESRRKTTYIARNESKKENNDRIEKMKRKINVKMSVIYSLILAGAVALAGCGQETAAKAKTAANTDSSKGAEQSVFENDAGKTESSSDGDSAAVKTIELTGNDRMQFNLDSFTVGAGEKVKVTLKNVGTMPKVSMGHNFVLLSMGVDVTGFANAASMKATTDYVPQDRSDDIIAHTKLLGPDESDSVTFQAPSKKGDYDYLCSFPGHVQAGMRGVMHVE